MPSGSTVGEGNGRGNGGTTYAALDLGTNNCRLLVARPSGDGFRVIDAFSRIIRLGEGLSASGRISEAAILRAVEALAVCRDKMASRGVSRARLIATEACRAAVNGVDFRARIAAEVGLELEIVDRETEAMLAAMGCTPLIDPVADGVMLFDIGGGSSELVRLGRPAPARRGPPMPEIEAWVSLPLGVVTLAERYGGHAVSRATYAAMVEEVAEHVQRFVAEHGSPAVDRIHLLGTSGTVTTIAGVHLELKRYERRRVDGCWMSDVEVTSVIERLMLSSYEERVANACIGAERADLVLAGCAILDAIRRVFPCRRLRVADRGLREGMLVLMMREDGVWGRARAAAQ
jgi:exopolyphosphatase/guanosine-5'-triphosphate,3'-diphosphate pyrophosphatase